MPKSHATLLTEVAQEVLETTPAKITTIHVTQQLKRAVRRIAEDVPREKIFSYFIESRTGKASATSSGYLVDTDETQFIVANDIDKVIHNTTDNTWAVVVTDGSNSTSKLKLSEDIMESGEDYEIYNKDCVSRFQINLEDIGNFIGDDRGVIAVEYPIGERRSFEVDNDRLTILKDTVDDSKVADPATDTEVLIKVNVVYYVSNLSDLAGEVDEGSAAAGDTDLDVDNLVENDEAFEDTEFTLTGIRGKYTLSQDSSAFTSQTTGYGGTLNFYPGLESAPATGTVITFIGSTLTRNLEPIAVLLAAGYCLKAFAVFPALTDHDTVSDLALTDLTSGASLINAVNVGGPSAPGDYANQAVIDMQVAGGYGTKARLLRQLGQDKINDALAQLERLRPAPASQRMYTRA